MSQLQGNANASADVTYNAALSESPFKVADKGNLYGFYVEGSSVEEVYLQIFDASDVGDVTVGTTTPKYTFRIPKAGAIGKDANEVPLYHFSRGIVVAVTDTRTGSNGPSEDIAGQFWTQAAN